MGMSVEVQVARLSVMSSNSLCSAMRSSWACPVSSGLGASVCSDDVTVWSNKRDSVRRVSRDVSTLLVVVPSSISIVRTAGDGGKEAGGESGVWGADSV